MEKWKGKEQKLEERGKEESEENWKGGEWKRENGTRVKRTRKMEARREKRGENDR